MLVLTRKIQEQIVIGENIKVTILRVKGNTVRVGIEAPRQVRVVRSELHAEPALPDDHLLDSRRSAESAVPKPTPSAAPLTAFLVGLALNAS